MHLKQLIGKKYKFLTIIGLSRPVNGLTMVRCKCDCGTIYSQVLENIERGKIQSCGCINDSKSKSFKLAFKEKIWSLIEIKEQCWIWKGSKAKRDYFIPYISFKNKQFNPIRYFCAELGMEVHKNWLFVKQCESKFCVNPDHYVQVSRQNMKKALSKEIKCEYLRNKGL